MADSYRIKIDMPLLVRSMSKGERRNMTEDEVREFLASNGVVHLENDWWLCEEITLGLFNEPEITARVPAD